MSIPIYAPREEYVGDGVLTDYSFDFKIASEEHLRVVKFVTATGVETFNVRGDDTTYFTVSAYDPTLGGGTVSFLVAPAATDSFAFLLANDEPLQESEFQSKGDFTLARFEAALDVQAGAIQRLAYLAGRSAKAADTIIDADVAAFDWSIPDPAGQAGKSLVVNATEDGFEWV